MSDPVYRKLTDEEAARRCEILKLDPNAEKMDMQRFHGEWEQYQDTEKWGEMAGRRWPRGPLSLEEFEALAEEGFIDLDVEVEHYPTKRDMLEFARNNPEVKMLAYAINPDRSDSRVAIEGFYKKFPTQALLKALEEFNNSFKGEYCPFPADEVTLRTDEARLWWG